MSVENDIQNLIKTLNNALEDAAKVDKGQKAAATRLRKTLQGVRNTCGDLRKSALEATRA